MPDKSNDQAWRGWHRNWTRGDAQFVIGLIVAIAIAATAGEFRKSTEGIVSYIETKWLPILLVITLASCLLTLSLLTFFLIKIKDSIKCPKFTRGRWGTFPTITYGHIEYEPFLKRGISGPVGLGPTLLHRLTNDVVKLKVSPIKSTWGSFASELQKRKFDVVATPLFATFDRTRKCDFTAPLFYSNIGLYVNADYARKAQLEKLSFEEMIRALDENDRLQLLGLNEEISGKLALKYGTHHRRPDLRSGETLSGLFQEIAESKGKYQNAIFSETFYGRIEEAALGNKVVNILQDYSILYPVCFAIKHGDYQLKNLLNLRLLHLAEQGGALKELVELVVNDSSIIPKFADEKEVMRHFTADWRHALIGTPTPISA